jgi:surface protein
MFQDAASFNGDLSSWKVGSITNMMGVFPGATLFNGNISGWDVSSVTDMRDMFYNASAFSNHDLSDWNVTNVMYHSDFSTGWGTGNIEPLWP